jgi:hypothetical protein
MESLRKVSQTTELVVVPEAQFEELHSRHNAGVHVSLLWNKIDNALKVEVYDDSDGSERTVPIVDNSRAMEVFYHPYAQPNSSAIAHEHQEAA